MPIQPPNRQQLEWIADTFHMTLTEQELDVFEEAAAAGLASFSRLDELPGRAAAREVSARGPRVIGRWATRTPATAGRGSARSRARPSGPLAGRTVAVKDNVCVAGMPMLNGSPIMEGYVPREDATVVTRLLDAGAQIVGKAAVPAFCFDGGGLTGYPDPQPVNPHNPAYLAGSSSNGSAVVVVNGEADLALGGDQGGSIRLPASWSGCCGHKPTWGLVPYTGIFPIELTIDHIGPMARTVADCALMLDAIAGEDGLDPRQIGVVGAGLRGRARGGRGRACAWACCRGLRHPGRVRARRRRRRARRRRHAGGGGRVGRGGLDPDAPRRARDLERDRDRGRDRPDGPRRRLRHQPQGPLHDRPRRLLRPRPPRPRRRLLGHGQAHGAARRLPVRGLQPPLLRQGPEPRPAAEGASTRRRSSASTSCCSRRRR